MQKTLEKALRAKLRSPISGHYWCKVSGSNPGIPQGHFWLSPDWKNLTKRVYSIQRFNRSQRQYNNAAFIQKSTNMKSSTVVDPLYRRSKNKFFGRVLPMLAVTALLEASAAAQTLLWANNFNGISVSALEEVEGVLA